MKKAKVYEYAKCSTCRKAIQFLDRHRISYDKVSIVDSPPTKTELKKMLGFMGGNMKKLFNTSGASYRSMKLGKKLDQLSINEAIDLLASDGKLVKRPFLLTQNKGLIGFNEQDWETILVIHPDEL